MFAVRLRNCMKLEISCSRTKTNKIRFRLYMHNKCVAFKNTCVVSPSVFVLYPIQNEAAAHHMHCCTDVKSIF